jgi:hypothetical protein
VILITVVARETLLSSNDASRDSGHGKMIAPGAKCTLEEKAFVRGSGRSSVLPESDQPGSVRSSSAIFLTPRKEEGAPCCYSSYSCWQLPAFSSC